jgi:hypothetical protein
MKEADIHKARSLKSSYITRVNNDSLNLYNREPRSTIDHYKMEKMPTYTLPFLSSRGGALKLSKGDVSSIKSVFFSPVVCLFNSTWLMPGW